MNTQATIEKIEHRLYTLKHLCAFIGDLALAAPPRAQCNEVMAESVHVTFDFLARELKEISDLLPACRAGDRRSE